eukprot:m.31541 g.31541  ORF g.31541 m.31541 type:complete len:60 (-) comp16479_c0_seq1:837-1016(-)
MRWVCDRPLEACKHLKKHLAKRDWRKKDDEEEEDGDEEEEASTQIIEEQTYTKRARGHS